AQLTGAPEYDRVAQANRDGTEIDRALFEGGSGSNRGEATRTDEDDAAFVGKQACMVGGRSPFVERRHPRHGGPRRLGRAFRPLSRRGCRQPRAPSSPGDPARECQRAQREKPNAATTPTLHCGTGRPSSSMSQTIAGRGASLRISPLFWTHVLPKIQP